MQWTIQLTALAIEARFKNKLILSKFASNTSDTKEIRGMWEDTINVFHQRALAERAWDSGAPRDVSIKQFMNKLNSIRAAYRLKRARLLATGNRVNGDGPDSDDGDDDPALARKYPEMPLDYLIEAPKSDSSDSDASDSSSKRRNLTCDPLNVNPNYRNALGTELAGLWPLLCDVFFAPSRMHWRSDN
ncbi:hypothetical protein PR003_g25873 [Phytophthora rubi]|nr:hypothetical protein PR003_g25873 [Phytophthora rubi]